MFKINYCVRTKIIFNLRDNYKMPTAKEERVPRRRRSSSRKKSVAQKRHQARAKQAMTLFKSGKASSLKNAWKHV